MKTRVSLERAGLALTELAPPLPSFTLSSAADLRQAIECLQMATVARLIVTASLLREETRGCFWRLDFPRPDNAKWLVNIVLRQPEAGVSPEIRPVVMTRLTTPTAPRIGAGCFGYLP